MIRKKMSNKRGFLLAEYIVKIIIALIVLGFLIFLLTALYFSQVKSNKLKQANTILLNSTGSLRQTISGLAQDEIGTFVLNTPIGWYFLTFFDIKETPDKCGGQDCVCICNGDSAEYCQKEGACFIVRLYYYNDLESELKIYISKDNIPTLKITKVSKEFKIELK